MTYPKQRRLRQIRWRSLVAQLKIAESAPSASDNSDYTAALRCTIETWSHDVGIAESIDEKGVIDLMQRLNTLKSALKTGHTRREK